MNLWKDQAPGVDANGVVANLAWYPRIVAKTADYTVLRTESGTFFTTTGVTAAINFTLPAITTGPWIFFFVAGAAQNMTVTAGTADTMVTFNDLAADSVVFSTSGEIIGGGLCAFTDGTTLFCLQIFGVSHRQTLSVTT
jgi:hypothetical protein